LGLCFRRSFVAGGLRFVLIVLGLGVGIVFGFQGVVLGLLAGASDSSNLHRA
jgi:hypothetical protein